MTDDVAVAATVAPIVNVQTPRHFRAPPFTESNVKLWFRLMEVAFKNASITDDEAKYCQSVAALTPCAIAKVEDVLVNAPNQGLYDDLKVKLIERFTESDSARVRKLLEGEEMGDRSPFEFYRSMKTHATSSTTDEFILQVWKTRLPLQVQAVMAASNECNMCR
ncbi:uncharacterized protein LOC131675103 [Phymastichus coffea]|uniref:uncharacterized protein LOC131675103 n=1 Tax=Phymastichus coffea TaxID=108790 RepID=UPI00273B2CFF|nr:uncharacterized protein LOC131675103 [Phymastichus coffea]